MTDLLEVLDDVREFVADYSDVVDGDYGVPAPNRAMILLQQIDAAIIRAHAEQVQG